MNNNEMEIVEIFHFQGGQTVFAGKLKDDLPTTMSGKYIATLMVDSNIYRKDIKILGQMMGGRHPEGYKAIMTDKVDLTSEFIKNHRCKLIIQIVDFFVLVTSNI
jgi:hypothetical protein